LLESLLPAWAADNDLAGTYKLVVEQRTTVDTGEIIPVKDPQGFITYGTDGRMMVIIVRQPRPKPESIEKTTDQERADLLRTMTAYAGTYKFDGKQIEHHIDISMNETWTGTTQVRSVKNRRGAGRLYDSAVSFSYRRQDGHKFAPMGKNEVKKLTLVSGNILVVKGRCAASDRGEGSTEGEMMVRVAMFSAFLLAAASVPTAAETGDDGGRLVVGQGANHAGHGHGATRRKQQPKVCTRNGLRASCQA
jgi:hypothetical protein